MQEEEPQGPSFPRPWYYRPEYMVPMFIFWPAGAILALRSPWNNNTMVGGAAWAVMIVGAVMGFKWLQAGSYQPIMTFYVPGILLTLVTQVQWTRYRHEMAGNDAASDQTAASVQESGESSATERPPRPTARRRRRISRTGRSKS